MAREAPAKVDGVLLALVQATNSGTETPEDSNQGLGLVLVVNGATISGRLIPNWLWFKKVEENIRKSVQADDETSHGLADIFSYYGDEMITTREDNAKIAQVLDEVSTNTQQVLLETERTEYIHLEGARIFEPGYPGLPGNGMLWRGRLQDISGWSLGLLSAQ